MTERAAPVPHEPSPIRETRVLLRRLSAVAPLAAAYAVFQAMFSLVPTTLSEDALRYLLAVAAGLGAGAVTVCATLWNSRSKRALPASADASAEPAPSTDNMMVLSRRCADAVAENIRTYQDPALGALVGVSHFLEETDRPTAHSTAYCLKIGLCLGSPDGRLNRADLADTLWKLQLPDGGWAARTQGRISRPETTALVLGALSSAGCDQARLIEATAAFERAVAAENDPVLTESTYVVTAVINGLLRVAPRSASLPRLRALLLDGAIHDPEHDDLSCWSEWLVRPSWRRRIPSTAHTARAIVTLQRLSHAGLADAASRTAMQHATTWLTRTRRLDPWVDHIRRHVGDDRWEALTTRHFTAAWVARALLGTPPPGPPEGRELLEAAMREVRMRQNGGVWSWDDGGSPLWMIYQGITVMREYALYRSTL